MIKFKTFWRDWLIVFVPTLLILLMVYIFFIYPGDRIEMSQFDEANEIYRDMNATTFRYGMFMILFVSWAMAPDTFSLVFENNRGILTYKEHAKAIFVDFEVLEING